ncbi:hypothetical protein GPECTOR_40g579 [Gonium pectorale]|uniref:Uncharacterized protein n=1 Tax=Gonium pectorale TaxID=33097 RepID=A0A150GB92_GONPE|nr:hypothetical protein GPECTOR_40g579 [Gonium pectorale]|eukprot:KXZ46845.1 hypothetical protein GPECTOR_40g579 [Gonium pectorale]
MARPSEPSLACSPPQQPGNSSIWSASSYNTSEDCSPSSPATSSPQQTDSITAETATDGPHNLAKLPLGILQRILAAAGASAGNLVLAARPFRTAWAGVVAEPPLAAQWLRSRYGEADALDALVNVPIERYLRPSCSTPGWSSQAPFVLRIHILGLLVVSGCRPRLSPQPAASLLRDACAAGNPQAAQLVLRCGAPGPGPAAVQPAVLAAVERGNAGCLQQIIRYAGADPVADCSLALQVAAKAGSLACVEELLSAAGGSAPPALPPSCPAPLLPLPLPHPHHHGHVQLQHHHLHHRPRGGQGHTVTGLALALAAAALYGHSDVMAALLRASHQPPALASLALVRVATVGGSGTAEGGGGRVGPSSEPPPVAAVKALVAAGADASAFGNAALMAVCQRPAAAAAPATASAPPSPTPTPAATSSPAPPLPGGGVDQDAVSGEVARCLIRAGADPRLGDCAPLVAACSCGAGVAVVAALLEGGADPGAQECAPLRYACRRGSEAVAALLLSAAGPPPPPSLGAAAAPAPVPVPGLFGLATAMAEAAVAGHYALAEACAAACPGRGVDPQAARDLALIQASQGGCLQAVHYLVSRGANAAACGSKCLAAAAEAGHADVVSALLAAGAEPAAREGAALLHAARGGRSDVVALLLAAGGDAGSHSSVALWAASEAGHMDTVATLMAAGADPILVEDADLDLSSLIEDMDWD